MAQTVARVSEMVKYRALFVAVAAAALLGLQGCRCTPEPPAEDWREITTDWRMPLGIGNNKTEIAKHISLGNQVTRFKLRLRFVKLLPDPELVSSANWATDTNFRIRILNRNLEELQVFHPATSSIPFNPEDGSFETNEFSGNDFWLAVNSANQFVDFGPVGSYLLITHLSVKADGSAPANVPPPIDAEFRDTSTYNSETHGFLAGVMPPAHFFRTQELDPNERYAIYVSPLNQPMGNDIGLAVGISTAGFVVPNIGGPASAGVFRPAGTDTGVYAEFGPFSAGTRLFITVRSGLLGSYLLAVNKVSKKFSPVIAMEDSLKTRALPALSPGETGVDWSGLTGNERLKYKLLYPYGLGLDNFLRPGGTSYVDRLRLVLALGSANMLAATLGNHRLSGADIFRATHWDINEDILIEDAAGRANTSFWKIHLFRDELERPMSGGRTMVHEWGHFEYGLPDEYEDLLPLDTSLVIDKNSIMGWHLGIQFHFCTDFNHVSLPSTGVGTDGMWTYLYSQYPNMNHAGLMPGTQGRYNDVLRALFDLMAIRVHD